MANKFRKDPDAVLDYKWNWEQWLQAAETIVAHTITVPSGITLDSDSHDTNSVTAWLSGGTINTIYIVACKIVTDGGRTDERSIQIRVAER